MTLASAADGLIAVKSPVDAKTTMDRVEAQAKQRGLAIFARIDHAAGQVWLGYTYLAQRHAAPECPAAGNIAKAMAGMAKAATAP